MWCAHHSLLWLQSCSLQSAKVHQLLLELLFLEAAAKFTKAVDEDVIEETAVKVRGVMDAVEASCIAGHFEPQTSKLCDWCFFKADCPAFATN